MGNTEKSYYTDRSVMKLIERSKHTKADLGGYILYMVILLAILLVDTVYYEKHVWYDADYDIYTGMLKTGIFSYSTVCLFKGTEGYRIIYGWRRWVLGCVFAVWTLFSASTWCEKERQTGEEIHSKTGYTRTELQEIRQSLLDEGYTKKDITEFLTKEATCFQICNRIYGLLYIASCAGLWYWTVSVKKIERRYQKDGGAGNRGMPQN